MMRVGVNFNDSLGGTTGNSVYARNLFEGLAKRDNIDLVLLAYAHDSVRSSRRTIHGARIRYVPAFLSAFGYRTLYGLTDAWNDRAPGVVSRWFDLDIFHFTNLIDYRQNSAKKTIVTLDDIAWHHHDDWTKRHFTEKMRSRIGDICADTDRFIAVSQFTKDDCVRSLGIDPDTIDVIYEGVSEEFFPDPGLAEVHETYGIRGGYILFVGRLEERKNVLGLVRAYAALPRDIRDQYQLVLRGTFSDMEYEQRLNALIQDLKIEDRVVYITKGVSIPELRKLYSNAVFFAMPSFFEGFGLPVIEARKCGIAVMTSNVSSLPEVGGKGAVYVDPIDISSMTRMMADLAGDPSLRRQIVEAGKQGLDVFDWNRMTRETVAVYARTLGRD